MARLKAIDNVPGPRPGGSWLAGFVIGSTIITLAAGAMVLGAGMAVGGSGMKGG